MKKIFPVDFVARPGLPSAGALLMLVAAGALTWQGWMAWQDQEALQHQREAFASLARQTAVPQRMASADEGRQMAQFETVAGRLAAPWNELLGLFEKHGAGDVALVRLEPDASTGLVTLTARARNRRVMMAYLLALESDPRLLSVLLNHHEVLADVEGTPVQFSITAQWRAAEPHRAKAGAQEMVQ